MLIELHSRIRARRTSLDVCIVVITRIDTFHLRMRDCKIVDEKGSKRFSRYMYNVIYLAHVLKKINNRYLILAKISCAILAIGDQSR
jgi:hypothetical protein